MFSDICTVVPNKQTNWVFFKSLDRIVHNPKPFMIFCHLFLNNVGGVESCAWKRGTILFSYKIQKFHPFWYHGIGNSGPTMLRSSKYSWTPSTVSKRYQWVSQREFKIQIFLARELMKWQKNPLVGTAWDFYFW